MSTAELLLGLDVGTGATKAALYDLEGRLLGETSVPSRLHRAPGGVVEQDPAEMEEELQAAIRGALRAAGAGGEDVAALACDGQMAGVLFVDAQGRAVGPYDSWLDSRCEAEVAAMLPMARRIIELTGGYPTYAHGPKLLWWMRHRPEAIARAKAMVMPAAYLAGRLAGLDGEHAFIDPSYLHFSCLSDTAAERWSAELVQALGAPDRLLPRIVQPWTVVGEVSAAAAAATGLRAGTPIAAGCGDTAAGLLGAGVVRPGTALDVAGSASVLATCVAGFAPDVQGATLFTARSVLPGVYYALAYVQGGGLLLDWFIEAMAPELLGLPSAEAYALLEAEAEQVAPRCDGLRAAPHFGGRVTPNDPRQRGAFLGLAWQHRRGHLYRALLEAVAFEYGLYLRATRELQPGLGEVLLRGVGGGSRSRLWNRIKAEVLGVPYRPLQRQEGGALGSALVAGHAVGLVPDMGASAEAFNRLQPGVDPEPDGMAAYQGAVEAYRALLEDVGAMAQAAGDSRGGA